MSNKNSNQVSLPFDLPKNEIKNYVAQHFNITFARQKNVGITAKKIMTNVMAQIKRNDKEFLPYYQLNASDVISEDVDGSSVYKQVKKAFKQLSDLSWLIENLNDKQFAYRHLLNTSDARLGYNNGTITIVLNPLLKEYFIEMAHYTTYDLKWSMTFGSWYSMRLFEILSAYKDTGVWIVSIPEYRKLMDCEKKYPKTSDLIQSTLEKPLVELEKTTMAFTVEEITDKTHRGRGRKPVVALEFRLKKVQLKIKEIPSNWFDNPSHAELIHKMKTRYRLSDVNIVKYSVAITTPKIRELLQSWDVKEASADPIKNKLHYCNSVFVTMGKAALEE